MRRVEFDSYPEAREAAQAMADELGLSVGIERPVVLKGSARPFQGWTIKLVPGKPFRFGWETRCEVVEPTP